MARIMDAVVGHSLQKKRLAAAIEKKQFAHANLFIGPNGIGKSLIARATAQMLVCPEETLACGQCPSCRKIEKEESENLLIVRPLSTQILIEQARSITKFLSLAQWGHQRIIIIEEAHALTTQAANALLKSIEEPPPNSFFILVAQSSGSVLPTIRSRCQTVRFSPLSIADLRKGRSTVEWIYHVSRGRFDIVDKLSDSRWQEVRGQALDYWMSFIQNDRSQANKCLRALTADKEAFVFAVDCWRRLLRDLWLKPFCRDDLHIPPDETQIHSHWPEMTYKGWEALGDQIDELDRGYSANVDRTLMLENFWLQSRALVHALSSQPRGGSS